MSVATSSPYLPNQEQYAPYVYLSLLADGEGRSKKEKNPDSVENITSRMQNALAQPWNTKGNLPKWFTSYKMLWLGIAYKNDRDPYTKGSIDYTNDLSITDGIPINIMYLAQNTEKPSEYFIGIAGTNGASTFDWIQEDFTVRTMEAWKYGSAANAGKISTATNTGLQFLINLKNRLDNKAQSLQEYLAENVPAGSEIIVGGHSLGGALSPTFALWLQDTRTDWGNNNSLIRVYSLAGASPGDDTFSNYLQKRIVTDQSAKASADSLLYRIHNTMDVVPHSWQVKTIKEIPTLYENENARGGVSVEATSGLKALAHCFEAHSKGHKIYSVFHKDKNNYTPIQGTDLPFQGAAAKFEAATKGKENQTNFTLNALYQHIWAYYDAVGITTDEQPYPGTFEDIVGITKNPPAGGSNPLTNAIKYECEGIKPKETSAYAKEDGVKFATKV